MRKQQPRTARTESDVAGVCASTLQRIDGLLLKYRHLGLYLTGYT